MKRTLILLGVVVLGIGCGDEDGNKQAPTYVDYVIAVTYQNGDSDTLNVASLSEPRLKNGGHISINYERGLLSNGYDIAATGVRSFTILSRN